MGKPTTFRLLVLKHPPTSPLRVISSRQIIRLVFPMPRIPSEGEWSEWKSQSRRQASETTTCQEGSPGNGILQWRGERFEGQVQARRRLRAEETRMKWRNPRPNAKMFAATLGTSNATKSWMYSISSAPSSRALGCTHVL